MWSPGLPLHAYRDKVLIGKDTAASELKKWAFMGPFFKEYGTYIMKQYPLKYAKHFMWPNFIKYYAPSGRVFGILQRGATTQYTLLPNPGFTIPVPKYTHV